MLNVRLEGCGWSKELRQIMQLRIETNLLTSSEHGEIARYAQGYWFSDGNPFISVLIEPSCLVRFEGSEDAEQSDVRGPYRRVRSSGGSIWVAETDERLLAKWDDASRQWQCLLAPVRRWPAVTISASTFDP
jgi:hypothetical protein